MRENASLWSKITHSYARPLLESSLTQQIRFEQYGELPDRLKICHEAKLLEEQIHKYWQIDPTDKFAFMKGMLYVNRYKFPKFYAVRMLLTAIDLSNPYFMVQFIAWIQDQNTPDTSWTIAYALALGLMIPLSKALQTTIWEYFVFEMIEVGHRSHTSLKTMLFKKDLRMSGATNKDFSEGEVKSIIMGETDRVWTFIWTMPDYIECPFEIIVASYFCFTYVGWYGFIVVLFTMAQFIIGYVQGSAESEVHKEKREKHDRRMGHINESFHNIKGVKLYGWETKFLEKIEAIYQEELALEDKTLYRDKFYELF